MSFLQQAKESKLPTQAPSEKIALPEGQYGSSNVAGLEIVSYIEKASKPNKQGHMRHSFLVKALVPSKESQSQKTNGKSAAANDEGAPWGKPEVPDGTAFLSLTLADVWLYDEPIAIAMGEGWVTKALESGVPQANIDNAIAHFRKEATQKCIEANTPEDQLEEAVEKQYQSILSQIRINVGQLFRLQDWKGVAWDPRMLKDEQGEWIVSPMELVGTQFGGRVTKSNIGDGSEVKSIYEKK